MKRATPALLVSVSVAVLLSGCGNAGDIWRSEFDARLDGVSAAIEGRIDELRSDSSPEEIFQASSALGRELAFRARLLQELDPPVDCESVQEMGLNHVGRLASVTASLFKNMTPMLHAELPLPYEEAVRENETLEREAEACA